MTPVNNNGSIIRRMIKTYRMWRYMRIVEKNFFRDPYGKNVIVTTSQCNLDFSELKTIFRRNYTSLEGVKACFMAEQFKYIKLKDTHSKTMTHVGITAKGLKFTALSGLINELGATIANVPPIASLIVALAAIIVSVLALQHSGS